MILLIWFFTFYWLINSFNFLYKKAQYTTYTRIIQRFWKRSLYLFWLIECYLFATYLFLTIITPQEVLYLMDSIWLYYSYTNNLKLYFTNIFNVIILILFFNIIILMHKYNIKFYFMYFIVLIQLLFILQDDFFQLYYINQYYTYIGWTFNKDSNVWNLEVNTLKIRTYIHYLYLLIFLKFWHTLFIVGFFLFYENIFSQTNLISFNILSANLQNFYFLLFFAFILKIVLWKHYFNYLYEYVYYWFYINYHFVDYNYFYYLFNYKYFLFI